MECCKYKVTDEIHVYDCYHGQLKIPKGKVLEIKKERVYTMFTDFIHIGICDGITFPSELLDICKSNLERIYD